MQVSEAARIAAAKIATEGLDERLLTYVTKEDLEQRHKDHTEAFTTEQQNLAMLISKV